jgi:hypothetical protein
VIDQHGVWLVVAVIAIGWIVSVVSAIGRASRRLASADTAAYVPVTAAPGSAAQIAAAPPARPQRLQRPQPVPAAPAAVPAAPGRGLAALLRDGSGIRSGVILAEVLAPPVSLR